MARNDKKIPEKKTVVPEFSSLQDAKPQRKVSEIKLQSLDNYTPIWVL